MWNDLFFLVVVPGSVYTAGVMKRLFSFLILAGTVCAGTVAKVQTVENLPQHEVVEGDIAVTPATTPPRNIILMIGDGMSAEHVWAAWVCNGGKLNMEKMPVTGFSRTYSANRLITDSAAGGTALACGEKTDNGMLGQAPDGRKLQSLAARLAASPYHKRTGVIVTKAITDATPAAFYAHTESRRNTSVIARWLCESSLSVIVGGGAGAFSPQQKKTLSAPPGRYVLLVSEGDAPYAAQRGEFLSQQTRKALSLLESAPHGFFLMIEGSKIDTASHAADLRLAVEETLDFDRALGVVLQWLQSHPDTLLVVTADHQTGGLAIHGGDIEKGVLKASFASTEHTGVAVPVYAAGCGALNFTGVMDNTLIPAKILKIVEK